MYDGRNIFCDCYGKEQMNPTPQSPLQRKILLYLSGQPVEVVAVLARSLGVSRPSASRSLHGLVSQGLIARSGSEWMLTDAGRDVCSRMQLTLPSETAIAERRLGQLLVQEKLASVGFDLNRTAADRLVQNLQEDKGGQAAKLIQLTDYYRSLAANLRAPVEALARMNATVTDVIKGSIPTEFESMVKGFCELDLRLKVGVDATMLANTLDMTRHIGGDISSALEYLHTRESEVSKAARALSGIETGISSILQAQKFSLSAWESIRPPNFAYQDVAASVGAALSAANLSMGKMLADMSWIEGIKDQIADATTLRLLPHLGHVSKSYGELFHETLTLCEPVWVRQLPAMVRLPAVATADYVRGVGFAVADGREVRADQDYELEEPTWSKADDFEDRLARLDPRYLDKLQGAWAALDSDNPDRIAQATHSGRELLAQALESMAPDDRFTAEEISRPGNNGVITRKMRVSKVVAGRSQSAVDWSDSVADAINTSYGRLSALAHSREILPPRAAQEARALLRCLEGWLSYLLVFHVEK